MHSNLYKGKNIQFYDSSKALYESHISKAYR